ncbi:MAG: helix-turn-helix domain-containing protein [Actinomycetota bacterium]|nr:helix-turn-helix domain-containing protein [Actinomycetota bacterium]
MPTVMVGSMLRDWRLDRRRSQMDLAIDVGVSTRHLSFVETGKSKPSPELVLALAEHLDVPLRERNSMLLAAGYAPRYSTTSLDADALASVRAALAQLIEAHDPFPAVVVDRHWNAVMVNRGAMAFTAGVAEHLLGPPLNVYRLTLHPDGMSRHIENLDEWATHLLGTLARQVAATRDQGLRELLQEVSAYPNIVHLERSWRARDRAPSVVVPLRLRTGDRVQSWFSTNTTIGTPVDITLDELHVELFHPADGATARLVRAGD